MTPAEITAAEHQGRPLSEHLNAYDEHLRAKNVTKTYREEIGCYLRRLAAECSFGFFADLRREALERWLAARAAEGLSARGRNAYRDALVTFCNWAVETHRLTLNPFTTVAKVNVKADPRRQRRAMDEPELVKLLAVARERPLLDALTVHKGPRKG
jgi:site-specific recombinase XerC